MTLIVIPTTILLTLFAANLMGYTINRVSLFALIFSIGILVDDAIVVIENIARHWAMHDGRDRMTAAIEAVAEVGNPTIVATLTVVAALLPMLFVSGMMGPYMAPIPANASAAMLFSFFVAMVIAPWLMLQARAAHRRAARHATAHAWRGQARARSTGGSPRPIVRSRRTRLDVSCSVVGSRRLPSCSLFVTKNVTVKLLPFDNKSELAVRGRSAGRRVGRRHRARRCSRPPRSTRHCRRSRSIQAYAGTAGAVQFQRAGPALLSAHRARSWANLQVNLAPQGRAQPRQPCHRARSARAARRADAAARAPSIKVVEVPPGPPVLSTLLAEIYGPDAATRRAVADETQEAFRVGAVHRRYRRLAIGAAAPAPAHHHRPGQARIFRRRAERRLRHAAPRFSAACRSAIRIAAAGAIRIEIVGASAEARSGLDARSCASTPVPANAQPGNKAVVELGDVVSVTRGSGFAHDLPPRRPLRRHGDGRARRRIRGADLRHARGGQARRRARLGRAAEAGDPAARPARRTKRSRRCCGTANGK